MNLLKTIIERLNQRVEVANIFDQIYPLCELNANGNDKAWVHYIGNGQAEVVTNFDAKQGTIFWAKRGKVSVTKTESLKVSGCKSLYLTTFPLTAYAVVRKSHLPCDSEDSQDWIASRIYRLISGTDTDFKQAIGVIQYEVIPNGYINEIKLLTANYEWACVAVDVDVNVVSSSEDGCYDVCATGDIPLPDLQPCVPCLTEVAVDGVTITGNGTTANPLIAIGGGGGGGVKIAITFSPDHLTSTGNQYQVGNVVWYLGNIYRCIAANDSILPTNATYWTNLGAGFETIERPINWNATSGNNQVLNKPTIPTATSELTNDSGFITSGDIPPQVNSDWNSVSGVSEILNKPTIPILPATIVEDVTATLPISSTGGTNPDISISQASTSTDGYLSQTDWNTFDGKFDVPTGTMTDYLDGLGTPTLFPTIPTLTSELTNDSGFITIGDVPTQVNSDWNATSGVAEILNKPTIPSITPSALTKVNDTNVTLTLGGSPSTSLLAATSLTLGWSGTLADSRITSAATWNAKQNAITTGTTLQYFRGDLSLDTFPTALPPSGAASGDLSGTYPSPNVSKIHGIDMQNGTPTADDLWIYGGAPAKWQHGKIKTINSTTLIGTGNIAVEPTINAGTTLQYYRGDKTFQTLDKSAVGLGNVDNTSDVNKPISTATQTALNLKQDTLVSGTNIKTINSTSILGTGNITTGSVTSVAALTLGTSGTDLSSSVATGTTTPVITLNVPTASAANRGALSAADWTTFNAKQNAITPAALTKVDDTNVTLTLGGTPTTALLQGASLTLGWTGTLADARITSAATWNAKQAALVSGTNIKTINSTSILGSGNYATPFELVVAASDETTALSTGTAKITFRMPRAVTLTAVRASLTTAQASGSLLTINIKESGTTILSTKITINNTQKTSTTATTPSVISDVNLADDAEITIDIDQIGDGTAKGLKVMLIGNYA